MGGSLRAPTCFCHCDTVGFGANGGVFLAWRATQAAEIAVNSVSGPVVLFGDLVSCTLVIW
jgi:hypothetical protein